MLKSIALQILAVLFILVPTNFSMARDYIIYNIAQGLPMGEPNEVIKKDFYVNIGDQQGVRQGTLLDVYRNISRLDPYQSKKRYNYKVKIGKLKIIHAQSQSSIAKFEKINIDDASPLFEIEAFMIGDNVSVYVKD